MKRKAIALALALSMMATMTPITGFAASVTDFKDVPASSWYYDSVKGALDDGYMNGVSSDTFKPAGNLTRAMFVTMLARFDKATVDNNAATAFADVKTGQWYTGSVAWAVQNGIVTGYSATKFGTDDSIKREDVALMVYRYAQMKGLKLKEKNAPEFNDQAQISSHAKEAMDYCRKYGIFIGDQKNNVYPQKLITRAEAAAVIERLKNIVDDSQTPVTPPNNNNNGSSSGGGHSGTTRYTITWVVDADGNTQDTVIKSGNKLTPPKGASDSEMNSKAPEGYEFAGWSKTENDDPANAITSANLPNATENAKYYPVWKKIAYTITWNTNGGTWTDGTTGKKTTEVKYGDMPSAPDTPTKDGYVFGGWNESPNATTGNIGAAKADTTYYAVWKQAEPTEFTITWDLNYPNAPTLSPTTVEKNATPEPPTVDNRTGWTLVGWNTNSEGTVDDRKPATENTTYYAIWAKKMLDVKWDANGGAWADGSTTKTTSAQEGTVPTKPDTDPTNGKRTFLGWNTNPKATTSMNPSEAFGENITYYAVWGEEPAPDTVQVTWDLNYPGSAKGTVIVNKGSNPVLPADSAFTSPEREGYTFKGWGTASDTLPEDAKPAADIIASTVTADTTYFAVWVANEYTITWHFENGELDKKVRVSYDSTISKPTDPTREHYDFKGWSDKPDPTVGDIITIPSTVTGNADYYAVWEKKSYDVTWDLNDGDDTHYQTVGTEALTNPVPPSAYDSPVRDGYDFVGWNTYPDASDALDLSTITIKVSTTFFAVWKKQESVLDYDIRISLEKVGSKGSLLNRNPSHENGKDDKVKYHVEFKENGEIDFDKSDDVHLVSVAKDFCSEENIDVALNIIKGLSFKYNDITQYLFDENDNYKVNDIIIGYMSVAANLPENTKQDIVDLIQNDKSIPKDIRDSVDVDTVGSLLTKLDGGVEYVTELEPEEKAIAEKLSEKLDDLTSAGDDTLVEKVKENPTAKKLIDQLGITDEEIKDMARDYKDALDAILGKSGTSGVAVYAGETETPSTKGGIPVKVNPAKAAVNLYKNTSKDTFIDRAFDLLPAQSRVTVEDLKESDGVDALYVALNPENWLKEDNGEYYLKDAAEYITPSKAVIDALEQIRQDFFKDKNADKLAERIEARYENALKRTGLTVTPALTSDSIKKLAEMLVCTDEGGATLVDLYDSGLLNNDEVSVVKELSQTQALSYINRLINLAGNSTADQVSDGVKESLAGKLKGTYTAAVTLTKSEHKDQPAQ